MKKKQLYIYIYIVFFLIIVLINCVGRSNGVMVCADKI